MSYPSPAERRGLAVRLLRQHGPLRVSALAALMGCSGRVLTGTTDATLYLLEEEGLVCRHPRRGRGTTWYPA